MSGDRALDAEVVQAVFGWIWGEPIWEPHGNVRKRWLMRESDLGKDHRIAADETPNAQNWDIMVPHFSTDIAAAWTVVQAMREQDRYHGFCWAVHQEIGYDEHVPEDLGWLLLARAASEVARMICRGALRSIAEPSVLDLGGARRMNAALSAVRVDGEGAE